MVTESFKFMFTTTSLLPYLGFFSVYVSLMLSDHIKDDFRPIFKVFFFIVRFAQFFISPLFTEGATEREVNAVNSENDKNLPSDAWRLLQLDKATADPSHPYSKFGTGKLYPFLSSTL